MSGLSYRKPVSKQVYSTLDVGASRIPIFGKLRHSDRCRYFSSFDRKSEEPLFSPACSARMHKSVHLGPH